MSNPAFYYEKWKQSMPETVCGSGSTIKNTENVRRELPEIIKKYNIKSIFDAPCGDRNWIKTIDFDQLDCKYYGGDVVEEIVEKLSMVNVATFDLRNDVFPNVDLWFCRDCLYHLSMEDIKLVIENAKNSNVKYILITSHIDSPEQRAHRLNKNITSGDYRCLIFAEHDNFGLGEPIDKFFDCDINLAEEMLLFKIK